MEDLLLALQPQFAVSVRSSGKESKAPDNLNAPKSAWDGLEDLENRFAALDVEEPAEQLNDAASPPTSSAQLVYEINPKTKANIEEEKLFAMFCLFDDLARLRQYLLDVWVDYLLDKNDLITTAVTTNAAFQLAIRTQDEILAAYPECGDYQNVLATILAVLADKQNVSGDEVEFELDGAVGDWIYAPAHSLLDSFCDVLQPGVYSSLPAPMIYSDHT
jgi:hypothetical protein